MRSTQYRARGLFWWGSVFLTLFFVFTANAYADWTTNGPNGMGIRDIAVDPYDSRVVYVTNGNAVYKSTDAGGTFTPHAQGLITNECINALAVHPFFSNIVYAGGKRFYRSMDGGVIWQEIGNGLPPQTNNAMPGITDILIDPIEPNIIYASTYVLFNGQYGGVYKSNDNGENFVDVTPASIVIFRPSSLTMDAADHNMIYAGLWGCAITDGIWMTTNAGMSWSQTAPTNPYEHTVYAVKADPVVPGRLFAGGLYYGCWKSEDYGASWELVAPTYYYCSIPGYAEIDIQGTNVFYTCEGAGLFRSTNAGVSGSWKRLENGIPTCGLYEVRMSNTDQDQIFVGGAIQFNLFKSVDNGNKFTGLSNGFPQVNASCIGAASVPTQIVYSGAQYDMGVFKTDDNGDNWFATMCPTLRVQELTVCPNNPSAILVVIEDVFCGNPNFRFFTYRSTDGGEHFNLVLGDLPGVNEIAFDPTDPEIVYLATDDYLPPHFYRSTNCGASWTPIYDQGIGMKDVIALCVESSNILYAGTFSGVYKSTNGGSSWFLANTGIPPSGDIYSLSKCYLLPDCGIVAGTDCGVYRTTNGGLQWNQVGILPFKINDVFSANSITLMDSIGIVKPILWAATDYGVFEYVNGDWWSRNTGLSNLLVRELTITTPISNNSRGGLSDNLNQCPTPTPQYSVLHAVTPAGTYEYPIVYTLIESDPQRMVVE